MDTRKELLASLVTVVQTPVLTSIIDCMSSAEVPSRWFLTGLENAHCSGGEIAAVTVQNL